MKRHWIVDRERGEIRISFPYDPGLLPVVRGLPGRRWDPSIRSWIVPVDHLDVVVAQLSPLGFAVSDDSGSDSHADGASSRPAPPTTEAGDPPRDRALPETEHTETDHNATEHTLGVLELNQCVQQRLRRAFPSSLWVVGEIVGFDRNAHKQHVFFQLAEKQAEDDSPKAVVSAVMFGRAKAQIARALQELGDREIRLGDGVKVRLRARVDMYPVTGSYQLIVEAIDPQFTLGAIAMRRERIVAELTERGLRTTNLDRSFPRPCLRVGLITSHGSDAESDFLNELSRSDLSFDVRVFDAHVQGQHLERQVLAGLRYFAHRCADFDVLVIVRGGGASTELMAFDTLPLGLAVAEHPLKIVIGIGHHRDNTVLDAIAQSEKTPTAAGKGLVELARGELEFLERRRELLLGRSEQTLQREAARLQLVGRGLGQKLRLCQLGEHAHLARLSERLRRRMTRRLAQAGRPLDRCRQILPTVLRRRLDQEADRSRRSIQQLLPGLRRLLARERERLATREARARAGHPERLLARGYSWLTDEEGRTIKSVAGAEAGARLRARVADGSLTVRVEEKHPSLPK